MTTFFTADLHLGHKAVLGYSNRPWSNVDDMNEGLINNWNEVVDEKDDIYVLGDISFLSPEKTVNALRRLKGNKYWIFGNHDYKLKHREALLTWFKWGKDLAEIKVPDPDAYKGAQRIMLLHYPMVTWNKSHYGAWNLHGHSHSSLPDDPHSLRMDVGVDAVGYFPISYEDVKKFMAKKLWKPVDHHTGERE